MKSVLSSHLNIIEGKIESETGEIISKKFIKGQLLGKGGFAKCYELKDCNSGQTYAAKIIEKTSITNERSYNKLLNEIRIHKSLNHNGIVKLECTFEDSINVYIILELCRNQTLKELVKRRKRLTEIETQCYLGQLIPTLIYIHDLNIIHRDLKLSNLFLGKNLEVKIGDFGLAAELLTKHERKNTMCGTPNYVAPEIIDRRITHERGHSFEVDIWAIGVITYAMLIGKPPFESKNIKLTYRRIQHNNYIIPTKANLSIEAIDFIKRILVPFPENRPSLKDLLKDPFMTRNKYPKTMPLTTLFHEPDFIYISQYMHSDDEPTLSPILKRQLSRQFGSFVHSPGRTCQKNCKLMVRTYIDLLEPFQNKKTFSNFPLKVKPWKHLNIANNLNQLSKPIYIEFLADFTNKYGIGYILTNNIICFFFNDQSNLLYFEENEYVYFDSYHVKKGLNDFKFSPKNCPKYLLKKLQIFCQFIQWHRKNKSISDSELKNSSKNVHIKSASKTNEGILIKLNNHISQMFFKDETQIVLSPKTKTFIFKTKEGLSYMRSITDIDPNSHKEIYFSRLQSLIKVLMSLHLVSYQRAISLKKFLSYQLILHKYNE